jgi:hypothetical protein
MIQENCHIKQKDTVLKLEISKKKEQASISTSLDSKTFVPGGVSGELLGHFEEGEEFLRQIVTDDKTWVHYYDHEKSMEYHHKGSPTQKKLKTKASAGKVMLTVFWNSEGVVLGFLEIGVPVTQNVTLKP